MKLLEKIEAQPWEPYRIPVALLAIYLSYVLGGILFINSASAPVDEADPVTILMVLAPKKIFLLSFFTVIPLFFGELLAVLYLLVGRYHILLIGCGLTVIKTIVLLFFLGLFRLF